jgi:hypothetical protein
VSDVADPRENLGVGEGAPPPGPLGGGPSLEDEERAMKGGKWKMMVAMILAVIAAVGLLVFAMRGDDSEQYRTLGRNVNGADGAHFNQFWGCALQNVDLRNLNKSQDLEAQIHRRAQTGTKRYTAMIDQRCMPKLAELKPKLDALIPPDDMREQLRAMSASAGDLRDAWAAYIAFVGGLQEPYDPEGNAEREHVNKIAKGWFDYRRSRKTINDAIREKINE